MTIHPLISFLVVFSTFFCAFVFSADHRAFQVSGESGAIKRPQELLLSPKDFIADMKDVLKRESVFEEIQKNRDLANKMKGSELVPVKNDLLWLLKKEQSHLDQVLDYKRQLENKLSEQELKALYELSQEFLLRVTMVNQFLFRVTKKELDYLASEADFTLPPQLAPEIPKIFDENQGVRFTPGIKPQLTIEPQ